MATRTIEIEVDDDLVDEPITFFLAKIGQEIKMEVPSDSPLNEFSSPLVYMTIARVLGKVQDMLNLNAGTADEDDY